MSEVLRAAQEEGVDQPDPEEGRRNKRNYEDRVQEVHQRRLREIAQAPSGLLYRAQTLRGGSHRRCDR